MLTKVPQHVLDGARERLMSRTDVPCRWVEIPYIERGVGFVKYEKVRRSDGRIGFVLVKHTPPRRWEG